MNRRRFLSNLGIGAAALMLRFAPDAAASVPRGVRNSDWEDGEYAVQFIISSGSFTRLPPTDWDGRPVLLPESLMNFTVKDGIITFER